MWFSRKARVGYASFMMYGVRKVVMTLTATTMG